LRKKLFSEQNERNASGGAAAGVNLCGFIANYGSVY
jgi:hypothetical protein